MGADEVIKYFDQLRDVLRDENALYEHNLDRLDEEIQANQDELTYLQETLKDAYESMKYAKLDMQFQDEKAVREKKERKKERNCQQKLAENRESAHENINSLIDRENETQAVKKSKKVPMLPSDYTSKTTAEEMENRLSEIEKHSEKLKDKTGLGSNSDALEHFNREYQNKSDYETKIDRKNEEITDLISRKRSLQDSYDDLKYTTEHEESFYGSDYFRASTIEDTKYDYNQGRLKDAERRLSRTNDTTRNIRESVDSIKEKLSSVSRVRPKLPRKSTGTKTTRSSVATETDSIVDSLDKVSDKIKDLYDHIGSDTNTDKVLNEIDQTDFNKTVIESRMPPRNTRVSTQSHEQEAEDGSAAYDYYDEYEYYTTTTTTSSTTITKYEGKPLTRKDVHSSSQSTIEKHINKRPLKKHAKRFR